MSDRPPSSSWVSERVVVAESRIEGHGLFATTELDIGDVVVHFGGNVVTDDELRHLLAQAVSTGGYVDSNGVSADRHLVLDDSIARFGNHSCDPTVWLDGSFSLVARQPLTGGDEITVDYATFSTLPEWSMRCRCGTTHCRGVLTGNDWRLPELQARYGDRWSANAQRLIASQR